MKAGVPVHRVRFHIFGIVALSLGSVATGQELVGADYVRAHYTKSEHMVSMRDGVKLFTAVYRPKDMSKTYPIVMIRTPYSCRPYGENAMTPSPGPSRSMLEDGYIFVWQDVRGRYRSEGEYTNMTPHVPGEMPTDESSDTFDTIDWLLENVEGNNGRVGMWGVSYPGFYAAAALPEAHLALKAVSPQAPIADFYFDDFHHHGAYTLNYFLITPVFGYQKDGPKENSWYPMVDPGTTDGYKFHLELGPLKNARKYYGADNFFWNELASHPNYDEFWQKRNLLPHLRDVKPAVMVVGGWFDAEDLYGPLNIYKTIERENPEAFNMIVMGPWGHGDWRRSQGYQVAGDLSFGEGVGTYFQNDLEAIFFHHFLKGEEGGEALELPEAMMYDTGLKKWRSFETWPPKQAETMAMYFGDDGQLSRSEPGDDDREPYSEYVSDPDRPVPDMAVTRLTLTPRAYMTADQRFATRRPDVVSFVSPVVTEPLTLAGEIEARLWVSTTGTDSDWIVKLVDIYPSDVAEPAGTPEGVTLDDYQQLVRGEILRGRFRESYETPRPFVPGEGVEIRLPLQDVFHTFKPGHRVMIQVQSSWFPIFDRNPQTFVPNIFEADEEDFIKATQRVYHTPNRPSHLTVQVLPDEVDTQD